MSNSNSAVKLPSAPISGRGRGYSANRSYSGGAVELDIPMGEEEEKEKQLLVHLGEGFASIEDFFSVFMTMDSQEADRFMTCALALNLGFEKMCNVRHAFTMSTHQEAYAYEKIGLCQDIQKWLLSNGFTYIGGRGALFCKMNEKFIPVEWMGVSVFDRVQHEHWDMVNQDQIVEGYVSEDTLAAVKAMADAKVRVIKAVAMITEATGFDKDGDLQTQEAKLSEEMDYATASFYPWINIALEEYFEEFMNSSANVLLLIGPPGTGKSTLVRTAIRDLSLHALTATSTQVILHPEFTKSALEFLRHDPTQSRYVDHRRRVVIVEDSDELLRKRSDGNMRMADILNGTNGIASDKRNKFIFSTNLKDLDEVDPALIRAGRCFDILGFRALTLDQANVIRTEKGMDLIVSNKPDQKYKLAEILNDTATESRSEPIVKPRFGFTT